MRAQDYFWTVDHCQRCGKSPLIARIMSWFTDATICLDCASKEDEIKCKLRAKGIDDAMEGCGYIPEV